MMRAISTEPPTLPSMFIAPKSDPAPQPLAAASEAASQAEAVPDSPRPDFRKMLRQGQKKDPVAGKKIREEEMVRCGYYLTAGEQRQFKLLAISNGHSMTELLRQAVQDYINTHRHKLPND
ncbi:hypothetical protein EOA46_32495 [Mesorhizobium sp. M1A.F.Ca.IN.022.05.2.1]|uniref:hypothetical protein n=2 Tax=Mesorhizobium TaxID=68287 RepID=UPI000FCA2D38|nr:MULTISPECIES: hypothetical protein [unclassified Mesorhizobium]RUW02585.1 hypothetical protein EOA46_32495 [Mesorhizobium sp. M1A.F.Ca.IN.022.05.2.1]RWF82890.1 MAG: hypothetical protein EOQ35_08165 [Mesorhizobium sp.]RWG05711.1 MAG: hypothetical protein EOQ38_03540 [Mesorhizobium sp.]RWG78903.1 MAG: hypothetical protein EOQ68_19090 [Mesorhizobium sp.]RWH04664.1 MAG: hypothetical protein EOQ71_19830 [Mesorhizobium sp.]